MDDEGRRVRREDVTQVITEAITQFHAHNASATGPDALADAIMGALEERGYEVISREATDRG